MNFEIQLGNNYRLIVALPVDRWSGYGEGNSSFIALSLDKLLIKTATNATLALVVMIKAQAASTEDMINWSDNQQY